MALSTGPGHFISVTHGLTAILPLFPTRDVMKLFNLIFVCTKSRDTSVWFARPLCCYFFSLFFQLTFSTGNFLCITIFLPRKRYEQMYACTYVIVYIYVLQT